MKRLFLILMGCSVLVGTAAVAATPDQELRKFRDVYKQKFPDVQLQDYANGVYAIDPVARVNWEQIEEFPPYEPNIDKGEQLFKKKFANGKSYADCFENNGAVTHTYPRWDAAAGQVVTVPVAINNCRKANGEEPLVYRKGAIVDLMAYMSYISRGNVTNVEVPKDDTGAQAAFEAGRNFYYTRRGQLNMACASCHLQNPGNLLRTELIGPAVGQTTHWPVYRSKWGALGTLHRRFQGCNKQVRAKAFKPQSEEYRNLEYFLTYLSNGIAVNGPGARK
jgi:sulfur-oxidizing protein SoxA